MNVVALTAPNGKLVYVNPEQVCTIAADPSRDNLTEIKLQSGSQFVTENPARVAAAMISAGERPG